MICQMSVLYLICALTELLNQPLDEVNVVLLGDVLVRLQVIVKVLDITNHTAHL